MSSSTFNWKIFREQLAQEYKKDANIDNTSKMLKNLKTENDQVTPFSLNKK